VDLNTIIQDSLLREVTYKATCASCRRVSTFESRRSLSTKDLPPVLAVNTAVFDQENIKFWLDAKKRRFLTQSVRLHGQIDGVDDPEVAVYELRVSVLSATVKSTSMKRPGTVARCAGGHATEKLTFSSNR
jgi:PAB-dependent poly(A)-specific ribonuclease subunit 2